jgi:transforming growth factor-beta-induced protein
MTKLFKFLVTGALFVTVLSCVSDEGIPLTLIEASQEAGLTTFASAAQSQFGFLGVTRGHRPGITVFAPSNEAFADALVQFKATDLNDLITKLGQDLNILGILGFHVVSGVVFSNQLESENIFGTLEDKQLRVNKALDVITVIDAAGNTATVTQADIKIENGVMHVINRVLLASAELPKPSLVEAATEAGLTTLLAAVTAVTGLSGELLNREAITVFVPTNQAFLNLFSSLNVPSLQGLIDELGLPAVTKVLRFHVVPATAFSFDLVEGDQMITTLAGEMLTVNRTGNAVKVTDAGGKTYNVIAADVAIPNGVVHVIDGVVLPTL